MQSQWAVIVLVCLGIGGFGFWAYRRREARRRRQEAMVAHKWAFTVLKVFAVKSKPLNRIDILCALEDALEEHDRIEVDEYGAIILKHLHAKGCIAIIRKEFPTYVLTVHGRRRLERSQIFRGGTTKKQTT